MFGGDYRDRTDDLLHAIQWLVALSGIPNLGLYLNTKWHAKWTSLYLNRWACLEGMMVSSGMLTCSGCSNA